MAHIGWSELQIKATIEAYFKLLKIQESGQSQNKAALYRRLAKRFPERSPKAFELKFQNISAILYEGNLPYCDGLKPRFNYQHLLKLMVLDWLKRTPLPETEPHEILFRKLKELKRRGFIPVKARGSGRFGLTIEESLGIPPNSNKTPDFMGIEIKTKRDRSLQTLFSKVPTRYVECIDKRDLLSRYGYYDDQKNRQALYTSFSSIPDTLGFYLEVRGHNIAIINHEEIVLEYDAEVLESSLLSKHSQSAFVNLEVQKRDGREECRVESAVFCKWPSVLRFLNLTEEGKIYLDFTLSQKADKIKDHGFLWRIQSESLTDLYLWSNRQALDN